MPPVNILYLHSHDTGRYVQPYGYAVPTPSIQRLAEQGVLFRQAFCVNPTCSASRSGLLTGMYPHSNGMVGLAHRGSRLNNYSQHLASYLGRQGYATALAGVQHEIAGAEREQLGYTHFLAAPTDAGGDRDQGTVEAAVAFLSQRPTEPFFLSCGMFTTHRLGKGVQPHNKPGEWLGDARYVQPPAGLPDTPEIRRDMADYIVAAQRLDHYYGQVLDAVDKAGLAENTLVICTTDHGIAFPHMKCNLTDRGIGVSLIMRGPGGFTGGKVCDGLVSHVDLFPTICEVAGVPYPAWLQGKSLLPLLSGQAESVNDAIFAEVNYHAAYEPMRCIRTRRHKYIRRFEPQGHPILPNCDDSLSKNELLASGWRERAQAAEELYDLVFDPTESCNLAEAPGAAAVLAQMRTRLLAWMQETRDPLLSGRVPPWPGMLLNRADGDSPQDPPSPC